MRRACNITILVDKFSSPLLASDDRALVPFQQDHAPTQMEPTSESWSYRFCIGHRLALTLTLPWHIFVLGAQTCESIEHGE